MSTTINLSCRPPSANGLFANVPGRGRVKSEKYRGWLNAVGWDLKLAKPERVAGPVNVTLLFERPKGRRRADLDNRAKAALDLLVTHGVIEDDHLVQRLTLAWAPISGCQITVEATR